MPRAGNACSAQRCSRPGLSRLPRRAQGWYDCVGMGAIPVLFDAAQLEMWPFQHALNPAEFVAFVPRALATSEGFNVIDYLAARFPVRLPAPLQCTALHPPVLQREEY